MANNINNITPISKHAFITNKRNSDTMSVSAVDFNCGIQKQRMDFMYT